MLSSDYFCTQNGKPATVLLRECNVLEHSTDIQNSLLKFNDLQDFYVRMAIVADIKRKPEFEAKMRFHAFDDLRLNKRVSFLSYDALVKQYEMEQEKQSFEFIL